MTFDTLRSRAAFAGYGVLVLIWLLLKIPLVADFPTDSGLGAQFAGGQQIVRGEYPHCDFRISYGPLVFYLSALAQAFSGGRIWGEWSLDLLGYMIGFLGLYVLLMKTRAPPWLGFGLAMLAAFSMSRIWKYFMVMAPVLVLLAAWNHFARPGRRSLAILAASVALAGLLRHDFGVFTFVCAAVAVGYTAHCKRPGNLVRDLLELVAFVFIAASPLLLWSLSNDSLFIYLSDSVRVALSKSSGLSLPFPAFHWVSPLLSERNALPWLYTFFFLQPLAAVAVFATHRAAMTEEERMQWLTTLVLGGLSLIQATHRSDFQHLQQATPVSFVLMALLFRALWSKREAPAAARGLVVWSIVAGFSALLLLKYDDWPEPDFGAHLDKFAMYSKPLDDFVSAFGERHPDNERVAVADLLRRCTSNEERIVAMPWSPGIYYLAGRSLGAGLMFTAPGYFDAPDYQRWSIEQITSASPVVFVDQPAFSYEGKPERALSRTHPILWQYLYHAFEPTRELGRYRVSVLRDLPPERRERLRVCLSSQERK